MGGFSFNQRAISIDYWNFIILSGLAPLFSGWLQAPPGGKQAADDRVKAGRDSRWNRRQRHLREAGLGEYRTQSGILHADLDGNRAACVFFKF